VNSSVLHFLVVLLYQLVLVYIISASYFIVLVRKFLNLGRTFRFRRRYRQSDKNLVRTGYHDVIKVDDVQAIRRSKFYKYLLTSEFKYRYIHYTNSIFLLCYIRVDKYGHKMCLICRNAHVRLSNDFHLELFRRTRASLQ